MKRIVYLCILVLLLSMSSIVTADQRGCDSNGKANARADEVRGCDTENSEDDAPGNNANSKKAAPNVQAANSNNASSHGQAPEHAAVHSNNAAAANNSKVPEGAGCKGLENAFSHISDDSPAFLVILRNIILHVCDDDGDGVPNVTDQCPDTAEGVEVGEDGCPNADTDNDGVPDVNNDGTPLDQCPDTPEGVEVDETGCPLGQPDLIIEIAEEVPANSCDASGCTLIVNFTVTNMGDANVVSDFVVSGDASPTGTNTVTILGGLAATTSVNGSIEFGPGQNCFDPDCSVTLTVDSTDVVAESDEGNNTDSNTWIG